MSAPRGKPSRRATSHRWAMMPTLIKGGRLSVGERLERRPRAQIASRPRKPRLAAGELVNPDGSDYGADPAWAVGLNCADAIVRKPVAAPKR